MGNELLPCPWCGSRAEYRLDVWTHEAGCANAECPVRPTATFYRMVDRGAFGHGGMEEDVRAAWNKRHNVELRGGPAVSSPERPA